MTQAQVARKLAALLFSDIKGYSSQMDQDEEGAMRKLALHNAIFDRQVVAHHGRTIKTVGDAYMVEFTSAVDAVRCGLAVQRELKQHNDATVEEEQIWVRMGIHVGDVIIKGDDLFGETVNIAARLEPKAPPGAICISQTVFNQVRRKVDAAAADMGSVPLKNIKEPFQLYALTPSDELLDMVGTKLPPSDASGAKNKAAPVERAARRSSAGLVMGVAALLLAGVAIYLASAGGGGGGPGGGGAMAGADAGGAVAVDAASTTGQPAVPVDDKPERGGVLRLGVEGKRTTTFDLTARVESVNSELLYLLFDPLMRYDPEADALVPGVIESWALSDDATRVTLQLRKGVWFHPHKCLPDGKTREATPEDVAFSIVLSQKTGRSLPLLGLDAYLAGKADKVEGVAVGDDGKVTLTMSKPTAWAVHNVASDRLVPRELEGCDDLTALQRPSGSGPFRLADSKPGFHFSVVGWDRYWDIAPDGKPYPYLAEVDISVFSDTVTSVSRLAKGALDVVEMPQDVADTVLDGLKTDRPTLKKRFPAPQLQIAAQYPPVNKQVLQAVFFLPGEGRPQLKADVRRAIAAGLDVDELAPMFAGSMAAAARFLHQDNVGYDAGVRGNVYDTAAAKKALAKAGHKDGLADFSFGHYPELTKVAEAMRDQLAQIGVKMRLVALSPAAMSDAIRQKSLDALMARWLSSNTNQEPYPYLHGMTNLLTSVGWSDPQLPKLAGTIMAEPKRNLRGAAYRELEKHLLDHAYVIPVARPSARRPTAFWLRRPGVHGLTDAFTGRVRLTAGELLQHVWVAD